MSHHQAPWYKELKSHLFWRCALAELLASVLYCFFATTLLFRLQEVVEVAAVQSQIVSTALALGFLVMTLTHGFGITHNAFIFPAITFGKCLMRHNSFVKSVVYFMAQMAGGIFGVALDLAFNERTNAPETIFPKLRISSGKGCVIEGLFSLLLVLAILATSVKENKKSDRKGVTPALVFGFAVAASFIIGYQQTGAVLNTAIAFGIGVVHNQWPQFIWIYWAGPLTGGILAGVLHIFVLFPPKENECLEDQESEPLYKSSPEKNIKGLDFFERNTAVSTGTETNISQCYQNPVFDGISEEKKDEKASIYAHIVN